MVTAAVERITRRIRERSAVTRGAYLARIQRHVGRPRGAGMGCANMAHAFAALPANDKLKVVAERAPHIGIVTAYNDMLSAHQPYESYPELIRDAARALGATAQVAGGVPAMCDGVTQGQPGMELSLFSRDVIALATAVALSHDVFDAALMLGVCDKIVPGLLIGALHFGHLPVCVRAGRADDHRASRTTRRPRCASSTPQGQVGREALLEAESAAYHAPGTCTFYGTANSNQMLMEIMGLHLPGSSFVNPGTPLREALTREAAAHACSRSRAPGNASRRSASVVDERVIVNAMVGLLATGGSTNHMIHLVAMARAAGILIDWDDFAELSAVMPLLARVYPNGTRRREPLPRRRRHGLRDRANCSTPACCTTMLTVAGERGLRALSPGAVRCDGEQLRWRAAAAEQRRHRDRAPGRSTPFSADGGLRC